MYSTQLTTHIGKDGILHLNLPLDIQDQEVEIIVVVHPRIRGTDSGGDLTDVIGAWQGEALVRSSRGDYETRTEFH